MSNNNGTGAKGIGVSGLLGVAFVILKLCHVIEWPWIWVTAPFWVPVAIILAILLVLAILKGLVRLMKWIGKL